MLLPTIGCLVLALQSSNPILVGADTASGMLIQIDPNSGATAVLGPLADPVVADLAYDPNAGILYGSSTVTDNLLRIDPTNGATTIIGGFGVVNFTLHGLGYDSVNDVLYGAQEKQNGGAGSELYRINVNTGEAVLVGSNFVVDFVGALAFNAATETMYLTDTSSTTLYEVDLDDGSVRSLGVYGLAPSGLGVGMAFHPSVGLLISDNKRNGSVDDELYRVTLEPTMSTLVGALNAGNVLGLAFVGDGTPAAAVTSRMGGSNPSSYSASAPVVGGTWTATVDLSLTGHSSAQVLGYRDPIAVTLRGGQVLLVGGPRVFQLPLKSGPLASWSAPLPFDPALAGFEVRTQAAHFFGVKPFALSNAQDLRVGY